MKKRFILLLTFFLLISSVSAFSFDFTINDNRLNPGDPLEFFITLIINPGELFQQGIIEISLMNHQQIKINDTIINTANNNNETNNTETANFEENNKINETNNQTQPIEIKKNISLDTAEIEPGFYKTEVKISDEDESHEKKGNVLITDPNAFLESCSVRASGSLIHDSHNFNNAKLSFFIPEANAKQGKGSLTAQLDNTRFSYSFEIKDILVNNEQIVIDISGELRINRDPENQITAMIIIDKINNKASIMSDDFELKDAPISFMKGCA